MAEDPNQIFSPKRRLTKNQAVGVMVVGGAMLVLPWFIPAQPGSTLYGMRLLVALLGFVVLALGAYFRP